MNDVRDTLNFRVKLRYSYLGVIHYILQLNSNIVVLIDKTQTELSFLRCKDVVELNWKT